MRASYAALMFLLVPLVSCAKQGAHASAEVAAEPEASLDQYLALLERSETDLRAQGVELPMVAMNTRDAEGGGAVSFDDDVETADVRSEEAPVTDMPNTGADLAGGVGEPREPAAPVAAPAPEDASKELAKRLDMAEAEQQSPARDQSGRRATKNRRDRCDLLCNLTESTCELEALICDLASRHPGDPRYDRACERAESDCSAAEEACHACAQ